MKNMASAQWLCPYCGHTYHYEDHICKKCGHIFQVKIVEAAIAYFLVALVFLLLFGTLLKWIASWISISSGTAVIWYIGSIATAIILVTLRDVFKAKRIRRIFNPCDAIPPRHDSSKWQYVSGGSCIKEGYCSQCKKMVRQSFHPKWTEWEFRDTNSCIQTRRCLRCGEVETKKVPHLWKKIGEGESGPAESYPGNRYYAIYQCERCGARKDR